MEKIWIMTDSCSDISRELAAEKDIHIVGIELSAGGRTIVEHYDVTPQEYWDILDSLDEVPTTAQITPVRFVEEFEKALAAGASHLLMVTINSRGSGTYNSCVVAKELFEEEHPGELTIEIIDGEMYSRVYGNAVLLAADLRNDGVPFDEIVRQTQLRVKRQEAIMWVYSLKHLKKSGRINGAAAFIGEALGLKPITRLVNGQIDIVKKVRGEKNVMPEAIEYVKQYIRDAEHQKVQVAYAKVPEEEIARLEKAVRDEIHPAEIERLPLGPCVTTNTGPNVLAVIYCGEQRD